MWALKARPYKLAKLASALTAGMNPHHPGHTGAYPHHTSLSSSPHHPGPGGPHHSGYVTGNSGSGGGGGGGGSNSGGSGSTSTPDLPSPHSPPSHSGQTDPGTPYGSLSGTPGMGTNGHHHGGNNMMNDNSQLSVHTHPHLPGHPAYPPVNHNNNCTLKRERGHQGLASIQECAGCGVKILERFLLFAMDRYWHNTCLKCSVCQMLLADMKSCFAKDGLIFCKNDYTKHYGPTGACHACGQQIPAHEYVIRSGGYVFHLKCFNCIKCGTTLSTGDKYQWLANGPICEVDWNKMSKGSNVSAGGAAVAVAGNGGGPRKNKVGRPRRSRE